MSKKLTTEMFIEMANQQHNNKYDYTNVVYTNGLVNVKIVCPVHGEFEQRANNHLSGIGCKKCKHDSLHSMFKLETEVFIHKAENIFGKLYDYSLVKYIGTHEKVKIVCPIHGEFEQSPANHYRYGCSKCSSISKGEERIEEWLKSSSIRYETQKRFIGCKNKRCLPFDFYIPDHNICVEFDGEHHYKIPRRSKCAIKNLQRFESTKLHDKIKDEYCHDNNIRLIRISYLDYNVITQRMESILV